MLFSPTLPEQGAGGPGGQGAHAMSMLRISIACVELQSQLDLTTGGGGEGGGGGKWWFL